MSVATFAVLLMVASAVMLAAPLVSGLGLRSKSAPLVVFLCLAQLTPISLAIAYLQYSATHMRIPFYSFARPGWATVFGALLLLQFIVTVLVLSQFGLSVSKRVVYSAMSAFAAVAGAFVASGVIACMNGNCF